MDEQIIEQLIFPVAVGLILLLVPVLVVYTVRSWKKINKKTKIIVLRYLDPVPKGKVKLSLSRLSGAKKITDPWMPIIFEQPADNQEALFAVMIQNADPELIDSNVQIKLDFYHPCINRVEIPGNRVEIREGGEKGSSFVSLLVKELLPEEKHAIRVFVEKIDDVGINKQKARSSKCGEIPIYIADVTYEEWKQ